MTYNSIVTYDATCFPTLREFRFNLSDGRVGVIAEVDDQGGACYKYSITVHNAEPVLPSEQGDWWDTVIREVGATDDFNMAEELLAAA